MLPKLGLLAGQAVRGAQQLNQPRGQSMPLRPMSAHPRHRAGGSLRQDGATSQSAPQLRQQATSTSQRSGSNLRSSLTRLRERLQQRSSSSERGNRALPERPGDTPNTTSFTRDSGHQQQPGRENRTPAATRTSARERNPGEMTRHPQQPTANNQTTEFTRASARERNPGEMTRHPLQPAANSQTTEFTRNSARERTPGEATRQPAAPPIPPRSSARPSRLETLADTVQTAADLHNLSDAIRQSLPPRSNALTSIPEEKHHELKLSEMNSMQQHAHLAAENDSAINKTQLRPQVASMALDAQGKLSVMTAVSENLQNILNETVARPRHTYQAHQASADNSQHLLMDPNGRLLSLQGSKTAFIGLTQSVAMEGWKQQDPSALTRVLDRKGVVQHSSRSAVQIQFDPQNRATISAPGGPTDNRNIQRTVALPESATHALLTGIFSHDREVNSEGRISELQPEQLREHGGRLYRLNEQNMRWEQVDKDEEKSVGNLSKQPNGMLYVVHDKKTLKNLSSATQSATFKEKISAYCTNARGEALLLLTDEKSSKQSLKLLNKLDAKADKHISVTLKQQQGDSISDFHATGIAIHGDRLLAIGSNGKLYSGTAPDADHPQATLQQDDAISAALTRHLGEKFTVDKLLHHEDGQLQAVVKDENDQRHICSLDSDGVLQPQWNLNESLVMDHHEGLLQPRPLPQETVELGRLGRLIIDNGKISTLNKNSQRWEASFEKADSIKRGQDGQAYVLNEGIPARVKVSLKSDKIGGVNNQFVMRQTKGSLSLDAPLPGFSKDNKAIAIAPLDAERLVALNEKGELQFHRNQAGRRQPEKLMRTLTKDGIENYHPNTLPGVMDNQPASGDGNTLVDIALDKQQTLFVLDKQGKLYSMPKEQWQQEASSGTPAKWQPVTLPDGMSPLEQLHNGEEGELMIADRGGRSAVLQPQGEQQWQIQPEYDANTPTEVISPRREDERARVRLKDASHSVQLGGVTLKRETNVMGMSGRDGNHINSRLRDRLRAHLFNPTLATPRPLKNAAYNVQHNWQGREGLRPVYQRQSELHQQLKTLTSQPDQQQRPHLQARLTAFEHSAIDKTLLEDMKNFADSVADSSGRHTALLGQQAGALKADRTTTSNFTPSRLSNMTQAMNPWSDNDNLIGDLTTLYNRYPLRADNGSHTLMQTLQDQGMVVRHQKEQLPMNRQRDPHDDLDLAKSRLILDGMAMNQLHQLADRMEQLVTSPHPSASELRQLKEDFRLLRDQTYGEDPIRKATSQGFVSHKQLEACYDAIKSMTNAFSKEHHGLNMTTRTVLKAKSQQEMSDQLLETISQLESGENMGFGRNYGGMLTLSVIPGGEVIGVPGIRGNLDRAYNASFSRGDSGINITFSRNGGGTGTVFGAVGWNPLTQAEDYKNIKADLGAHRSLAPSARLNLMVAMALQRQMQNSVTFSVSEADLAEFMADLTSGNLAPQKLLAKGVNHRVKNGTTLNFNVDATGIAMAGGGITMPTRGEDTKTNPLTIRATAIVQGMVNVLSKSSEHSVTYGDSSDSRSDSNNRVRFLNSAGASAGIGGGLGITANADKKLRIPLFGISNTSIQATMENRTKQNMSLDLTKADGVEKYQLDKLIEQIGLNFDEARLNALVQELKDADKPPKKAENKLPPQVKTEKERSLKQHAEALSVDEKGMANMTHGQRAMRPKERDALKKLEKEQLDALKKSATASSSAAASQESDDKLNTYQLDEKQAIKLKLDKLTDHLLTMTPANNGQYAVINSAKQLKLQQQAAALNCQQLNSAEYSSSYSNLRKIDHEDMMHVLHNLVASELPPSNAERISRFMAEKPMLKEVIRELQKHADTQATVTLEMKDGKKFEMQQKWLEHDAQPEEIQALLKDSNNLRVKSIAFTETTNKPEGINLPLFVAGGSSSANVNMTRNLGKINFSYGENQETPNAFSLEGEIAWASDDVVNAMTNAEVQDKRGVV